MSLYNLILKIKKTKIKKGEKIQIDKKTGKEKRDREVDKKEKKVDSVLVQKKNKFRNLNHRNLNVKHKLKNKDYVNYKSVQ